MVTGNELFQSPELTKLGFCWWRWIKGEVYIRKVDTRDELLKINSRRKTRDIPIRFAKCIEVKMGYSNIYSEL
jgi:hypothetical protein